MEISFSLFVNPFGSDVTCMYIGTGSGQSTCSGTMKLISPGEYSFINH